MIGYNTAYIVVVLCLLLSFAKGKRLHTISYVVTGVFLVCLCGFRHPLYIDGNDTYGYHMMFLNASREKLVLWGNDIKDPAFLILNKLIGIFTNNVIIYDFIIALLTIPPVLVLYRKFSPLPLVAVFLYVCMQVGGSSPYFMAFNQMRQALAIGFMCIAIYYYINDSYHLNKKVIFFLVIMWLTHWSSFIMAVPFLLKKIRLNKYFYITGMIVAAVAGLFTERFVPQLSELFLMMEQGFFIDEGKKFSLISNLPLLLLSCYVFFTSSKDECNSFEHKCLFLQFVLFGLLAPFNNSIFRFCIYYGIIGNLAVAYSFHKDLKKGNALSIGVAMIYFVYFSYVLLFSLAGLERNYPYSMW